MSQQLVYRIKDIEAHAQGVDIDALPLSATFMTQALQDTGADAEKSTATVTARLIKTGGNILSRGKVHGHLAVECQRCLSAAEVPVDASLNVTFVPHGTAVAEGQDFDPFDPDDVEYAHHDGEVIDLSPLVREQLILSLPITVLCKEDCLGLCPVCGSDRNMTTCGCQQTVSLSPFAALSNLKL